MNVYELLQLEQDSYERAREASSEASAMVLESLMDVFGYDLEQGSVFVNLADDVPNHVRIYFELRGAPDVDVVVPAHATISSTDLTAWIMSNIPEATNVQRFRVSSRIRVVNNQIQSYESHLQSLRQELAQLEQQA